jgi:hypothetical protein
VSLDGCAHNLIKTFRKRLPEVILLAKRTKAQKKGTKTTAWKLRRRKKYDKPGQSKPKAGKRGKYWVPAYTRADGVRVKGHWRVNHHQYKKRLKKNR